MAGGGVSFISFFLDVFRVFQTHYPKANADHMCRNGFNWLKASNVHCVRKIMKKHTGWLTWWGKSWCHHHHEQMRLMFCTAFYNERKDFKRPSLYEIPLYAPIKESIFQLTKQPYKTIYYGFK